MNSCLIMYSIRDLANLSGIKSHTIRMWEKRYGIFNPMRTDSNIRYYSDKDLKLILNIAILNKQGIKISNISKLSTDEIRLEVLKYAVSPTNQASAIEGLILAMIELDEQLFERIFNRLIMAHGMEITFVNYVFPFMHRIGVLWQIGSIIPAQEHFIFNLIRQKLYVAINDQQLLPSTKKPSFLLILPEHEWHELGLLFVNYILKKRNFPVIYLGQSVPLEEIMNLPRIQSVDYVLLSFILNVSMEEYSRYMHGLLTSFNDKKVIITGQPILNFENINDAILKVHSYHEFLQLLSEMGD